MKCNYRFEVHGFMRPQSVVPIRSKSYYWQFELEQGLLRNIVVTVQAKDPNAWPVITQDPTPGARLNIRVKSDDNLPFIQTELRTIQGLLSLWGIHSIDIQNPEVEWTAENEEERSALVLHSVKQSFSDPAPESIPPLPFDLLARSVLAGNAAYEIEMPLSFFRHGLIDLRNRQYIEAIYDFYFVLETMFAEGSFKARDQKKAFGGSSELCKAIKSALEDPLHSILNEADLYESLKDKILKMTVAEYIDHIVDLRGFLHHHTQRRKGIWSPERQEQYETDAVFLQLVTHNVLSAAVAKYLEHPEVLTMYRENLKGGTNQQCP
jgi:hypothetical protein